jgi:hypothetical protein
MSSVFTPLDHETHPFSLKTSTSIQEWCGHVYIQTNAERRKYRVTSHSYFQEEADQEYTIPKGYTEDDVWNRIRIAPETLPEGEIKMVPGAQYARLKHRELKQYRATAEKSTIEHDGKTLVSYNIEYPDLSRTLIIYYAPQFPHTIEYFEETYPSGFGETGDPLTSKAEKTHRIMSTYWQKNGVEDAALRRQLGLPVPERVGEH